MSQLKVALVGTNIGSTLHVRSLNTAGFAVTTLVGRDAALTAERAALFDIPIAATSVEQAIDSDIDAIVIATPPESHVPMALAAMKAGKHVLCEKPLALTATLARASCATSPPLPAWSPPFSTSSAGCRRTRRSASRWGRGRSAS